MWKNTRLWATKIIYNDSAILLSRYKIDDRDSNNIYRLLLRKDSFWVPNVIIGRGLRYEDGSVKVKLEKCAQETGIWLKCFDDYEESEVHLYSWGKPSSESTQVSFQVSADYLKMKSGEGPINVILRRISNKRKNKEMLFDENT